jgi:amino acid adenylation domain-containing protein
MSVIDTGRRTPAGSARNGLPLDQSRRSVRTMTRGMIPLTIDRTTVEGLRRAARLADGELAHALTAAYAWWLHMYVDSTDVVFGCEHELRDFDDLRVSPGSCVTPVILQGGVSSDEPFTALVGRIRRSVDETVPADTMVKAPGVPQDRRHPWLFETLSLFQPARTSTADAWPAKFDVNLQLDERSDGRVVGWLVFSADSFDRETALDLRSHWCHLLAAVAAEPETPLAEHDLVTAEARERQLSWNRTTAEELSPRCVHEVVAEQVERTPDAIAVQVGDTTVTYQQLDDRAALIASRLVQEGAGPGTVVALLLERTPDVVAAILGVLKSGAAFLPLDPRQPDTRNALCINDVGAGIVVTDRDALDTAHATTATVINIGDIGPNGPGRLDFSHVVSPTDLAYVICTSGSTGQPKPVLIEHRGVTNLMRNLVSEFGIQAGDTVVSVASLGFDMALSDIFCALAGGARVVLANAAAAVDPASLSDLIADSGATYMMATPTSWKALIAAGWRGDRRLRAAAGGETLTDGLAEALLQRCGAVWNGYGPTEATAGTSVARIAKGDTITVGRPLPNLRVYITNARGRLQPVGVPGEICIGGVGVGRGYLNRPDEQARRFGDDPFHVGGRIYRTGDRGRFLPDGRIQHLGRYDEQLKIRGFRIEPGEIESILCEHPKVGACAVVARELPGGGKQLVAYIVDRRGRLGDAEARAWLRDRLPEYMVPSAFVHLPVLPLTANGKLDKAALPAPQQPGQPSVGVLLPRTNTETRVASLWAALLGTPVTDVGSDFFDLGGHSLLAARLISDVQQTFGVELSLATFIDSGRTIAELAALLDSRSASDTDDTHAGRPLHLIFSDLNTAMSLRHFTAQWGAAQPLHALIPDQPGGRFDRSVTIEEHARQLLSKMRDRQPDGPLALAGFSIGGLLAYEVARQAVESGQRIDWLGILDAPAPSITQRLRARLTLRSRVRRLNKKPARQQWAKYLEIARRLLRTGQLWPSREFDYRGAADIACRYQLPGHHVPVHLFVTAGNAADVEADLLGWDEFHHAPLAVHRLAADHDTMLDLPVVDQLAQLMLESLRQSRANRSADLSRGAALRYRS